VGWLKSYGRGYQTRVNILLRHAMMDSFTRTREKTNRRTRSAAMVAARRG